MAFRNRDGKTGVREAYWRRHHLRWEKSGLSQAEYCRRKGITLSTFTNWRRKLSGGNQEGGGLVEIAPLNQPLPGTCMELVIPSVGILRLPETIGPEVLRHILLAIRETA